MRRPRTLAAFTTEEQARAHLFLATRVVFMMGRKFEEGDWSHVYCQAKGIPESNWSNLDIDIMYQNLGVEHKMLSRPSDTQMRDICGTRLMHPSATRSIRISSTADDPNVVMADVLTQYADLIAARRRKIAENSPEHDPDMRTGWLLWQPSLREFLYFEEEMIPPNPQNYRAEWRESTGSGRKPSKNLWIYELETGYKRYSVTTVAGAKIQPYFDVPPPSDPNVYIFRVQGEDLGDGRIRIWIAESTVRELARVAGELSVENLSLVIANAANDPTEATADLHIRREVAVELTLAKDAYNLLSASFPGVSDEHMVQLLVRRLRKS